MAKANAATGTTMYVAEGDLVPDLPGVRLVGPGAPDVASEVDGPPAAASEVPGQIDQEEGGEQPSAGSSSSASTSRQPSSDEPNSPSHQSRARTTGRRSKRDQAGSSSVSTTDGSGPETT